MKHDRYKRYETELIVQQCSGAELNHKQRKNTFTSLDKHRMYDFFACTGIQKEIVGTEY
jgi:hypothetical protein